jgi:Uma2 family endonuclease
MYDLPSEDLNEPGLPDEYHYLQPQLLSATLRLTHPAPDQIFSVGDMNLYYDVRHPNWYKRPDWFLVLGVPRLYEGQDMRLSYVTWQEGISPFVIVELLSPGTEKEDLGETRSNPGEPPTKWEVYEQILRVPYYIIFDRYTNYFRAFGLIKGRYQPLEILENRLWVAELELGLGIWEGEYQGVNRQWLRWYNEQGWILTDAERAEQAEASLALERQQREELLERLRARGINPDDLLS